LGTAVTNNNYTQNSFNSRLNSEKVLYYSPQNLSIFPPPATLQTINFINFSVTRFPNIRKTLYVTLREEQRFRVFENRVLKIIFVAKRELG
jgi:hypothetical protein